MSEFGTYVSLIASTKVSWKCAGTRTYSGHTQIYQRRALVSTIGIARAQLGTHLARVGEATPKDPLCGHLDVHLRIEDHRVLA